MNTFHFKKALVLVLGTLLLAGLIQAADLKYKGQDASVQQFLSHPSVEVKIGFNCKLISEENGLIHEFDTLGDFEISGQGLLTHRVSLENLSLVGSQKIQARLSFSESTLAHFSYGTSEHQLQLEFSPSVENWKTHAVGTLRVSPRGLGSVVIDVNESIFLKCVSFKRGLSQAKE